MKYIKNFLLLLFLILSFYSYGGVGRFNVVDGSIGIQTSHNSKFHAHFELQILPTHSLNNIIVNACATQIGYAWYIDDEIALRSGWQGGVTGLHTPEGECVNYIFYSSLVPIGGTVYPFANAHYIGFDMYGLVDVNKKTIGVGAALVVRF